MAFKPTLVALAVDPVASPFLGFPLTEIALTEPTTTTVSAAIPRTVGFESRDKFVDSVTGSDSRVARRKLADLELVVDYVSDSKKAEIERLFLDDRTVFFCPNLGPDTRWSFPFQRSLDDFTGNRTLVATRTGAAYFWDEDERVFKSVATDQPQFPFRGAWSRYLRTQPAQVNVAAIPHPTNTGHGWTTGSGALTYFYTEGQPSPVLAKRQVAGSKGILHVDVATGVQGIISQYSTPTLDTTKSVVGSVCIAWKGTITVTLTNIAGTVDYGNPVTRLGDGRFQLIRLGGKNTDATNQARIRISFDDYATQRQTALIGPVMIASDNINEIVGHAPKLVDWTDGVSTGADLIKQNDTGIIAALTDATFSWFGRFSGESFSVVRLGSSTWSLYISYNVATDSLAVVLTNGSPYHTFSNVAAEFLLTAGGWHHFAVTLGGSGGVSLYVDGVAHSENGSTSWHPKDFGGAITVGTDGQTYTTGGGISHLRLDAVEWSAADVLDHYDTYFSGAGRGVVEPLFGKELVIDAIDWAPFLVGHAAQWRATIALKELGPYKNIAGLIRQEGGV